MDGILDNVVKFINSQPKKTRDKYIAFLRLKATNTTEDENKLYTTGFSFEDMRLLTSGITSVLLESIDVDKLVSNVSSR